MLTLSLLLFSCISAPIAPSDATTWQGWVYGDIPAENTPALEVGSLTLSDLSGENIIEGEQRDEQRLGYWTFEIDPDQEVSIRIAGPEHYPTIWRGRTPSTNGFWYSGAIFGVATATFDAFLADLSLLLEAEAPLEAHEGVNLYGEPLPLSQADLDAWTDATIRIYDGEGAIHEAISLVLDEETGGLALPGPEPAPTVAFVATDLAPGPIALVIDASDGRSMVVEYLAEAGDLLSAVAFTLPLEQR